MRLISVYNKNVSHANLGSNSTTIKSITLYFYAKCFHFIQTASKLKPFRIKAFINQPTIISETIQLTKWLLIYFTEIFPLNLQQVFDLNLNHLARFPMCAFVNHKPFFFLKFPFFYDSLQMQFSQFK